MSGKILFHDTAIQLQLAQLILDRTRIVRSATKLSDKATNLFRCVYTSKQHS